MGMCPVKCPNCGKKVFDGLWEKNDKLYCRYCVLKKG